MFSIKLSLSHAWGHPSHQLLNLNLGSNPHFSMTWGMVHSLFFGALSHDSKFIFWQCFHNNEVVNISHTESCWSRWGVRISNTCLSMHEKRNAKATQSQERLLCKSTKNLILQLGFLNYHDPKTHFRHNSVSLLQSNQYYNGYLI